MDKESQKYSTEGNIEAEFEPGGKVLKNKLGIRSRKAMDHLEFGTLLKTQERCYRLVGTHTQFRAKLIQDIHKGFLGRIYKWAGKYRTVNLEKGGFRWPPAYLIEKNMAEFERNVLSKYTPCKKGAIDRVARDIAIVHAELLLIHPFRDGNGRVARLVANLMALQAGCAPLDFYFYERSNRDNYLKAVSQGYAGNYEPLTQIIMAAIKRSANADKTP